MRRAVLCAVLVAFIVGPLSVADANADTATFLPLILCERTPAPTRTPTPTRTNTPSPTPTNTLVPKVRVLSSNAFVPYGGSSSLYIAGEVRNDTATNVEFVKIHATLRNSAGSVVDSDYCYSFIDILTPGMTSPFLVLMWDVPEWASYELAVTWSTTDEEPYPLELLNMLSSNAFVPYEGSSSLYVVGEVRNDAGTNVRFVRILVTLRNFSGSVVDCDYSYASIDILTPGMTSPFLVLMSDRPGWASYDLVATCSTTSDVPYSLELLNSTSYWDSWDDYHVAGEIKNQYADKRTYIQAFVTLYDASGEVIGVDYTYTNPYDLDPGQTASFDCDVCFWKGKPDRDKVKSHLLQVYDD